MKASNAELVALIAGEITAEALATRHGVSEQEVLSWRAAFREGMRAASAGQKGMRRFNPRWAIAGVVVATAAFAQLVTFQPNAPAIASEVNANFTLLKTWLEQKVGTAGSTAVTISGPLVASSTTTTSSLTPAYATWGSVGAGSAAIVNDNQSYKALMIAGNTSAGSNRKINLYDDVFVNGNLTINGGFAPRSAENLRIIRGTIPSSGAGLGTGYSIVGAGTATPGVNFTNSFSATPTVVCSVGPSPTSLDVCAINSVSSSGFQAIIGVRNIGYYAEPIHFIAIGPN